MQIRPVAPWRIQDLQTGAKVERRRREYLGAEGVEGVGCGEIFLTLDLKMSISGAF